MRTYVIVATNYHLGQVPCNINQTLFGAFTGYGEHDSEDTSREFATREEAEAAKTYLECSGDWETVPDYEIAEVEAVPR